MAAALAAVGGGAEPTVSRWRLATIVAIEERDAIIDQKWLRGRPGLTAQALSANVHSTAWPQLAAVGAAHLLYFENRVHVRVHVFVRVHLSCLGGHIVQSPLPELMERCNMYEY